MKENPNIALILEYYGATVPSRAGWAKMKCPFHNDSHASAAVNLKENVFKCHGCEYKGDGYAIIMLKEGVGFIEAISSAQRIFDSRGEVLPQRSSRSGGIPRRARNNYGTGNEGSTRSSFRALGRT